jgi:hypothetical protein
MRILLQLHGPKLQRFGYGSEHLAHCVVTYLGILMPADELLTGRHVAHLVAAPQLYQALLLYSRIQNITMQPMLWNRYDLQRFWYRTLGKFPPILALARIPVRDSDSIYHSFSKTTKIYTKSCHFYVKSSIFSRRLVFILDYFTFKKFHFMFDPYQHKSGSGTGMH